MNHVVRSTRKKKENEQEEEKKTKVGKTLSIGYSVDVILMRLAPEAKKVLERLPKETRHIVRKRAIELSKEKGRDYDVRLEDVVEAKEELESKKREGKI